MVDAVEGVAKNPRAMEDNRTFRPGIEEYATAHTSAEPDELRAVEDETRQMFPERQTMLTGMLEGRFLKMLVELVQPQLVVEVGTFTGYSALAMAEGLPPGGRVITLELSGRHAAIAQRNIDSSPHRDRIEVRQGPAIESLERIEGPIDFAFIDADKTNYQGYFDAILARLSPHGLIAIDNVLWYGRPLDSSDQSEDTVAIRAFNDRLATDGRVEAVMLTVRDGVTLVRRRS